ncbi:hypothetical protein QAD02_009755 [Eretmocerus hayati]|uniref:Uncharacterized protein n=1 Tax=Eretmocerus hayati TaxID=131215 RepID=A0ACC2NAK5_9HYME|nr:hypothetical protein QAD02_009755 [Eretmocerus hayati]
MERWGNKVAVVTGASSGIGLAISKALVSHGLIVVGLARRLAKMENEMKDVKGTGKFYARECDITKEEEVVQALEWVKDTLGSFNILINNAGTLIFGKTEDTCVDEMEHVVKLNILGLLYCTKYSITMMKETQTEAHIININSDLGHNVPPLASGIFLNIYPPTKFAVRALSETWKNELSNSKIRVTNVSPGLVKTELWDKATEANPKVAQMPALEAQDLSNAIVYVLGAPSHVEINELRLTAKRT